MTANPAYEFTDREQHILKLLVDHYIEQGAPVGSRTLSRLPGIDISAASVRNVMGDLEHMGLLKSPHTSAGRVPTSAAFRVFVDNLLEVDYSKDELAEFARELNHQYLGRSLAEVRDRMRVDLQQTRENMSTTMQMMIDVAGQVFDGEDETDTDDMLVAGEANLIDNADLGDVSKLRELFDAFEQKRDIFHLLERCVSAEGVQIFIGRESGYDALGECSVVTAPYEINGKLLGVVGVVGPKRMSYAQVIPVVDVTSKLLSAALNLRS